MAVNEEAISGLPAVPEVAQDSVPEA